jgi:hypothetical protein
MLISEMHFTEKSYLKLPKYTVYHMNHPAGTAQSGTAVIIKNSKLNNYSQEELEDFYSTLGHRFIAGDYNAKHSDWGSRLITPRECEVFKMVERNNLKDLSMGEPT